MDRKSDGSLQESASIREGLKAFCHDFNLAKVELGRDDIEFSRLLVQDGEKWMPYVEWAFAQNGRKLRPQTRVKLQVVLKDNVSSKTLFLQEVAYRAAVVGLDSHGPTFDVLFTKMDASQFEDLMERLKNTLIVKVLRIRNCMVLNLSQHMDLVSF